MSLTVISLGGPLAPEGEVLLQAAGVRSLATGPYPKKAELAGLLAAERPEAIVVRQVDRIDDAVMGASPALRLIAKHGAGTNDIDLAAAAARGIPVLAATGCNAHSVAEHALALMLGLVKDLRRQDAFVRDGGWEAKSYRGHDLRGRRLGLVGMGMISRALAAMAGAMGMEVWAYDPFAADEAFAPHAARETDLDRLLATSDLISLHCPLTAATRTLIGARQLSLMKPTAFLINTARGEVVDEAALLAALRDGRLAGAGLDCFAPEPPAPDNPLWALPNVLLSPHIGGVTEEARREVSLTTVRNVLAFLKGEAVHPRYVVKI